MIQTAWKTHWTVTNFATTHFLSLLVAFAVEVDVKRWKVTSNWGFYGELGRNSCLFNEFSHENLETHHWFLNSPIKFCGEYLDFEHDLWWVWINNDFQIIIKMISQNLFSKLTTIPSQTHHLTSSSNHPQSFLFRFASIRHHLKSIAKCEEKSIEIRFGIATHRTEVGIT